MSPAWLRPAEAAAYCGVARSTLYTWITERRITASKPSANVTLIRVAELDAFLESKKVEAI